MDKARDEAINALITGQEKIEKDISGMKVEMSEMKADISDLKVGQQKLEAGHQKLEGLFYDLIQTVARIEKVVINIENDLRSRVAILFDSDKTRQHETADLKEICQKQEARLEDHELRIFHLEKGRKTT